MATENILIKFTADTSGITKSIDELQKMGKVTEDDAKKLQMLEGIAEGVADALKEAGVDAKNLNKQVTDTANSGKSLRTQFSEAKNEAVKLSKEFGAFSKEAREAAKRAALIKDEIADLNANLDALNPEAKLNAFVNLGQGIQGAFQVATGALQVFGVENERITKLAQQFQGVLNLTQGINSVLQLKDVYTQLRLVLGVTTAAQSGLNAAMLANPIGALTVVVLALASAFGVYKLATDESTESLRKASEAEKDLYDDTLRRLNIFNKGTDNYKKNTAELDIQLRLAQGKITKYAADLERLALQEAEAIAEIQSKPFGEKSQLDVIAVRQIQRIYALRRQVLEAEQSKENKNTNDRIVANFKSAKLIDDLTTASKELVNAINKELAKVEPIKIKIDKTGVEFNEELFDREEKRARESQKLAIGLAKESFSFIQDLNQIASQQEFERLQSDKDKGIITEEQYQKKLKELKLKQAKENKEIAIFNASLAFGEALLNALTFKPANAVPAALILASAVAGLNLARIIATPLPKFKEGTLNVGGGNLDSDGGMHAIIHRGEAVMPKDRNRDYHPTVRAIFQKQIKASDINAFVQSKLSGKIENRVSADIDVRKLSKAMNKGNGVQIENASIVGKVIARELASQYNRRNLI